MVDFIFSDKTGTLTCNIMKFRGMSIYGKCYGLNYMKTHVTSDPNILTESFKRTTESVDFEDRNFMHDLSEELIDASQFHPMTTALSILSLCHSVMVENHENGIRYSANSPDDLALVSFAKEVGGF